LNREQQEFINRPRIHDTGTKTVLGRTGNIDGADVLEQIVAQPQAARFITSRLWNFFAGEMPSDKLNGELAAVFRQNGNNFKPLLRVLFRSEEFFSPSLIRTQVKSPVQWLIATVRMLEIPLPPPAVSWGMTRSLGQDLFAPPNVKGWDGGLSWITTNTLLSRYNFAATLVQGDNSALAGMAGNRRMMPMQDTNRPRRNMRRSTVNVEKIFTAQERTDKAALIAALEKRLLQSKLKDKQAVTLREFLDSKGELDEADILAAIRLVMSTPEYQLT
jgi:uncharacterized protein (DUF1800 family)